MPASSTDEPLTGVPSGTAVRRFPRPTRLQLVVLAAITLLALGPLLGVVIVLTQDEDPSTILLEGGPAPVDGARIRAAITAVTPTAGEMRVRIVVEPDATMVDQGRLTTGLSLLVNDIGGQNSFEFAAGEPLRPVEFGVALTGGSISRYPFDAYQAVLTTALLHEAPGEDETAAFTIQVESNVSEFNVSVAPPPDQDGPAAELPASPTTLSVLELQADRGVSTSIYATWIMVLMWALALAGVGILWAVVIWRVDVPWWGLGYLVGVLFAVPQLREILPGRPPPGTLLDYVSFYWSIAVLGVTLLALVGIWTQRSRPVRAEPAGPDPQAPPPPPEPPQP